jgi:hypothetical protein
VHGVVHHPNGVFNGVYVIYAYSIERKERKRRGAVVRGGGKRRREILYLND